MARLREFDTDDVLQKAMQVFWRRGYAATAMSDIYAATGLKPGSLYTAFKDKEGLFRRCFETYAAHFRATLPQDREGLPAIRAWLDLQAKLATEDLERKGCLIVNTITERDQHSAATRALAAGRLREIRDFFVRNLAIAGARNETAEGLDPAIESDSLVGAVVAIMSLGRAGADDMAIANIAKSAMARLQRRKK